MQRDHDQLQKMICSLLENGVKISKTKSRLELGKLIEDYETIRKRSNIHS